MFLLGFQADFSVANIQLSVYSKKFSRIGKKSIVVKILIFANFCFFANPVEKTAKLRKKHHGIPIGMPW